MRTALLCLSLLFITLPAWADRVVEMGQPILTGTFMGRHAADCVDSTGPRMGTQINGCFDQNLDPVMKAWQRALARNRLARGSLQVSLHILPSGAVDRAAILGADQSFDQTFQQDVLTILKGMNFRKAANDNDVVHIYRFTP